MKRQAAHLLPTHQTPELWACSFTGFDKVFEQHHAYECPEVYGMEITLVKIFFSLFFWWLSGLAYTSITTFGGGYRHRHLIGVLILETILPLLLGSFIGPLFQNFVNIMDYTTTMPKKLSEGSAIHYLCEAICKLSSTMNPLDGNIFFDPVFDDQGFKSSTVFLTLGYICFLD